MAEFEYKAGLHHVGSYQVSGIPYATASLTLPAKNQTPLEIKFPSITRAIHVHNNDTSNALRIGFSANGVSGSNYWLVEPHASNGKNNDYIRLEIKTDKIFLLSNTTSACTGAYVGAELTGIKLDYDLASQYSGSNGIG